ncbi:hypothetical protein MNBD_PLANCTO02-171 [hydrothermal vent metagenome]|uniref:Phytol kinase n=1 Tax=hydrothermal vent metagenome TaxID=652676 RepID=A0A3B1DD28_9ZZZZ
MAGTTSSVSNRETHRLDETGTSPVETLPECGPAHGIDSREIYRKLLHGLPATFPFIFHYLTFIHHPDPIDEISLMILGPLMIVIAVAFLTLFKFVRRPGESNFVSTVISYPAAIFLTLLIFPGNSEFAAVVVVVLALGDSAACFCGQLFGQQKLPWNQEKSWMGTICFVLVSTPVATAAFYLEANNPTVSWGDAAICAFTASIMAAIAESLRMKVTDNLRVGIAAAIGVSLSATILGIMHQEVSLFRFLN